MSVDWRRQRAKRTDEPARLRQVNAAARNLRSKASDHLLEGETSDVDRAPDFMPIIQKGDSGTTTRLLARLQRQYGNEFVQREVSAAAAGGQNKHRRTAHPEPARALFPHELQVKWRTSVKPGGEAPGESRVNNRLFQGDTIVVSAAFPHLTPEQKSQISLASHHDRRMGGELRHTWVKDTLQWELTANNVGVYKLFTEFQPAGWGPDSLEVEISVSKDFAEFVRACGEASNLLDEKFSAAQKIVDNAAQAYSQAFKDQEEALNEVAAHEKMMDELIWGAFMAALGGPFGSLGKFVSEAKALAKFSHATQYGFLELTIETGKFSAESLHKLGEDTEGLTGPRRPTGKDPLEFLLGFSSQIEDEKAFAMHMLGKVSQAAGHARDRKRGVVFDKDPVALMQSDDQLETIKGMPAEKKDYLRQLWATWLKTYAWEAKGSWAGTMSEGTEPIWVIEAKYGITHQIKKQLEKAAKQCGESADEWIAHWAPQAKAKAEKAVKESE